MKQRLWRILPPLLLTLCILFTTALARDYAPNNAVRDSRIRDAGQAPIDEAYAAAQAAHKGSGTTQDEAERSTNSDAAVAEAVTILTRLEPSGKRQARFSRPSGIIGTGTYYAYKLFSLLFLNVPKDVASLKSKQQKLSRPMLKAVKLLETAANDNNTDAMFMLAEMNFYGNYTYPRDYVEAFRRYNDLAMLDGNSSAQHMIGFMYSTGIGGAVKHDQAKAMLYHTFAAEAGDIRSEMTIAFRHHSAIATPRNCEEAVHYYKKVADKAIRFYRSGPPGGHSLVKNSYRIADEEGGVYGEGASVSSSGALAKQRNPASDAHAALDDVLEYLDLMSRKGEQKATFSLGRLHYEGSRALKKDLRVAKEHFMQVARQYWTASGKVKNDVPPGTEKLASKAAGYIGRMFLRGEGMEQNLEKAKIWFKRGIANGDSLCQYSMGLMYLHGLAVPRDPVKAALYFGAAADQDLAAAQTQLGMLFLDQGDVQTAIRYFDLAARNQQIEAYYYLAELSNQGVGRDKSCTMAAIYYKLVAERVETIHSSFEEANAAYEDGDLDTALVDYMMAAEQGFENAQANVAYLLDQARPRSAFLSLSVLSLANPVSLLGDATLALVYWTRSAKQSNIDSMVKMGDYYYEGLGITADPEKAAASYQAAAETMQSAQAMWNLGWMHENGIGMEQDFHLAKRFYDQALETNREAYLPVKLALLKLRSRSYWNTLTHGKVNSIREEPAPKKEWSLSEWITNFIEADAAWYNDVEDDDWDTHPENPVQDDFYDDFDEGLIESLVIIGLAAALAFLVYYRQQRQVNHRRAAEEQNQAAAGEDAAAQPAEQQPDGGFFPQPGDPALNDWVAGGIGH
ncbi:hypothetical protein BJ546DRAFT_546762 [Cryomyces antarcticus]